MEILAFYLSLTVLHRQNTRELLSFREAESATAVANHVESLVFALFNH